MKYLVILIVMLSSTLYAETFTFIALTDTHTRSEVENNRLADQVEWIIENKDIRNIKFVIHSGDFASRFIDGIDGHLPYLQLASEHMNLLTLSGIPNLVSIANHDYNNENYYTYGPLRESTNYNEAFPLSNYEDETWFGGSTGSMESSYGFFSTREADFLVMGIEYCPTIETIEWAHKILSQHEDKKVILFTHSYFRFFENGLIQDGDYSDCWKGYLAPQDVYDDLIKHYPNIFLVTSGHSWETDTSNGACRQSWVDSKVINQVRANYQNDLRFPKCKNTHFRIYTINPKSGNITVKSFSTCAGYDRSKNAEFNLNMYYLSPKAPCVLDVTCGQ